MLGIAINLSHFLFLILLSSPQCRTEWFEFPTTPSPKLLFVSDCVDETFISTLQTGVIFTQQLIQKNMKKQHFPLCFGVEETGKHDPRVPLFVRMAVNSTPILHVYCSLVSVYIYPDSRQCMTILSSLIHPWGCIRKSIPAEYDDRMKNSCPVL